MATPLGAGTSSDANYEIKSSKKEVKASKGKGLSGKEKERMILDNDPTLRFAVGISGVFRSKDLPEDLKNWKENKKWVPLKVGDKYYKAEVDSVASRLGISKNKVAQLCAGGTLSKEFTDRVNQYNKDLVHIKTQLDKISGMKNESTILNDVVSKLEKEVKDPELQKFCSNLYNNLLKSGFNEKDSLKTILQNELENFVSLLPKEPIKNQAKLKGFDHSFFKGKASKLSDSNGEEANRISFVSDNKRYAIKTDGYLYPGKPKADSSYVPYSENGKDWIRLNIDSLSKRFSIPANDIKKAAKDPTGDALKTLIQSKMPPPTRSKLQDKNNIVKEYFQINTISENYVKTVNEFADNLVNNGFYYDKKDDALKNLHYPDRTFDYWKLVRNEAKPEELEMAMVNDLSRENLSETGFKSQGVKVEKEKETLSNAFLKEETPSELKDIEKQRTPSVEEESDYYTSESDETSESGSETSTSETTDSESETSTSESEESKDVAGSIQKEEIWAELKAERELSTKKKLEEAKSALMKDAFSSISIDDKYKTGTLEKFAKELVERGFYFDKDKKALTNESYPNSTFDYTKLIEKQSSYEDLYKAMRVDLRKAELGA